MSDCFVLIPDGEGDWATACFADEFRYESDWKLTVDHVVPRSADGTDDPTNLHLSHMGCQKRQGGFMRVKTNSPELIHEWSRAGGKLGGPATVARGHLYRPTHDECVRGGRIGGARGGAVSGPDNGRRLVERGALVFASHVRWHVNRGITKTDCEYCDAVAS